MAKAAKKGRFPALSRFWYNLAILVCICIIAGCILASILTVYIFKYIADEPVIDLTNAEMSYTTILYAKDDATGDQIEMQRLHGDENRIWVNYENIPKDMINATIALEDKRFLQHQGVDWKRTIASTINLVIPIYEGKPGGSTITQQVIKNITNDDGISVARKAREILRAMKLEKHFSKEQIMEVYLNTISLGNNTAGVQAAANLYFNKDISELHVAECAALISITQNPTKYNPFTKPENLKNRQEDCLFLMHEQGYLNDAQYQEALDYELVIAHNTDTERPAYYQSWFVDQVIEDVIDDLVEKKGYTTEYANDLLFNRGLRIYTTADLEMQSYLENAFNVDTNAAIFPGVNNKTYPEGAFVVMDLSGQIKGIVGSNRTKEGARLFNRARDGIRHPGSTIKPIASYAPAIERNLIHYSSLMDDHPITLNGRLWPVNFYGTYMGDITVDLALRRSTNTIPVKLQQMLTPAVSFDFLKNSLGMDTLVESKTIDGRQFSDVSLAPMALGEMTDGVTPLSMAGAYQIFGNGGYFTKPYSYTKVLDSDGNVILENKPTPKQAISSDTASVMNHLMQGVTRGAYGTGTTAPFSAMPVAGKTGTSDNDNNQWFIGVTPYYVGVCWLGYDIPEQINYRGYNYAPPIIWKNIMGPIHQGLPIIQFKDSPNVVAMQFCTETGLIAGEDCTELATGWYKKSNIPDECRSHGLEDEEYDEDGNPIDPEDRPSRDEEEEHRRPSRDEDEEE